MDEIYHLASPASPKNYMYNPIKTIKTNTMGTINMLGKALQRYTFLCQFLPRLNNIDLHHAIDDFLAFYQYMSFKVLLSIFHRMML